jgi:hypothetical protein
MLCCDICSKKGILNVEGQARTRETIIGKLDLCDHHFQEFTDLIKTITAIYFLKKPFTEDDHQKLLDKILPTFPGHNI